MRKLFLRILIGFVTCVIGISAVFVTSRLSAPQTESAFIIAPVYKSETGIPRFMPTGRGCGGGYSQGYVTDDEQPLAEGVRWHPSKKIIRREFREWVRDAKQVIEEVPKFRNHRGEVGRRIVIISKASDDGNEWVSILFHDGDESYRFIDAPTLDLALEFEQYLIGIDFKSPM